MIAPHNAPAADPSASLRRGIYAILICVGVGGMIGRILAVDAVQDSGKQELRPGRELRRPFLSANDRSRWCTIRALVEPDMRVPGKPYAIDTVVQQPRWDTIDMVAYDGHFYSSKPTLLPTILAGEYWLIYHFSPFSLAKDPFTVVRVMLITVNVIPLLVYFLLLARLAERFGGTDFGRVFVMASATLGTFLSTFAVVLNNHVPAAVCAAVAFYAWVRVAFDGQRRLRYFVLAGVFAALAAADELPALSLVALLGAALLWKAPRQTLAGYVPGVLLVMAGFFGTNWIAFQSLRPPYMHRSRTDPADNWYDFTYQRNGKTIKGYWTEPKDLDRGEASPVVYAVNALVGHHGVLSLTPVWLLSVAGTLVWLRRGQDVRLRQLAAGVALLSLVCIAFYLSRPMADRNYGGMTSGLRWMFWFAPLWLVVMLPAADWLAARPWTRGLALILLGLSVLSVSYPTWNPWTHPWLYDGARWLGWL